MKGPIRAILLVVFAIVAVPLAIFLFVQSKLPRKAPKTVTDADIAKADLLPGFACLDLGTGLVTEWDPEDLGEEDDDPRLWDLSFRKTRKTLKAWLAGAK